MPWDVWFGSFDNGTTESRERQRARLKAAKREAPREDASWKLRQRLGMLQFKSDPRLGYALSRMLERKRRFEFL